MSEEMIVQHCSPTLAGMKTGNIFACSVNSAEEMRLKVRCLNRRLVKKGLRIVPLRYQNNRALIYVYRPSRLSLDLRHDTALRLLSERGYGVHSPEGCVIQLIKRLSEYEEFPHEIGLFLGYPPEDVCGFIEKGECKCIGHWKVYNDEDAAKRLFKKYDKCTDVYCRQFKQGRSIERLTVAS